MKKQRRLLGTVHLNTKHGSAHISKDGKYRYKLTRELGRGRPMLMVMLNPSTADAEVDDPTIKRCKEFAMREGCGDLVVVNLFGYRASDPKELPRDEAVAQGPMNDTFMGACLRVVTKAGGLVVCAWGNHKRAIKPGRLFRDMCAAMGVTLWCLGTTKNGEPRHPLYVKGDTIIEELK